VGARAVQVGTASFVNPRAMPQIIDGIGAYLEQEGCASVSEWIGGLRC